MFQMWIIFVLIWLSVEDWKEGLLSVQMIFVLGVTGLIHAVYKGMMVYPWIGVSVLLLGWCTNERIGYGDGWLLLALGMWLLPGQLITMLLGGVLIGSVWALLQRKNEIPLVPFMTVAYMAGTLI